MSSSRDPVRTLAEELGAALRNARATVATAESCTGGGVAFALTAIPGSSDYYLGGIIAYANAVKIAQLGVRPATLEAYGAVSPETAREMAAAIRDGLRATYGVSVTGIAGPGGGSMLKPEGLVYIACATPSGTRVDEHRFDGGRDQVREKSIVAALEAVLQALRQRS